MKRQPKETFPAFGKIPPQAVDLEEVVIGAILIEKNAIDVVEQRLTPQHFYKDAHATIFQAAKDLKEKNQPIDLLTITKQLRLNGTLEIAGGPYSLSQLTNKVASTAHLEAWVEIVCDCYIKRELIAIANDMMKLSYSDETESKKIITDTLYRITQLELGTSQPEIRSMKDVVVSAMEEIHERIKAKIENRPTGVPTFSDVINGKTGGFVPGLSIWAGRPGEAKTAAMLQSIKKQVECGFKVGVISLEMRAEALAHRMISNAAEVDGFSIRDGNISEVEMKSIVRAVELLYEQGIYMLDNPWTNLQQLEGLCRKMVAEYGVQMIWIDYFQLLDSSEKQYGNEVNLNEKKAKLMQKIGRSLNIPIAALCQLVRTHNRRPTIEDLRGGGIEQASDLIILNYDELYTEENQGVEVDMISIVGKAKHGSTVDAKIHYKKQYQQLFDGHKGYTVTYKPLGFDNQDKPENDIF